MALVPTMSQEENNTTTNNSKNKHILVGDDDDQNNSDRRRDDQEEEDDDHEHDMVMPGFRFHPTEEELVEFYLRRKVEGKRFNVELITFLDLYRYDPWELPALAAIGEKEWFFYVPRDRKYRNGDRPNRVTTSGYWKATGADRMIRSDNTNCGRSIGLKKTLVFYSGKAPKGIRTSWIMNEYRLPQHETERYNKAEISLCRVYKRAGVEDHHSVPRSLQQKPSSSRVAPARTHVNISNKHESSSAATATTTTHHIGIQGFEPAAGQQHTLVVDHQQIKMDKMNETTTTTTDSGSCSSSDHHHHHHHHQNHQYVTTALGLSKHNSTSNNHVYMMGTNPSCTSAAMAQISTTLGLITAPSSMDDHEDHHELLQHDHHHQQACPSSLVVPTSNSFYTPPINHVMNNNVAVLDDLHRLVSYNQQAQAQAQAQAPIYYNHHHHLQSSSHAQLISNLQLQPLQSGAQDQQLALSNNLPSSIPAIWEWNNAVQDAQPNRSSDQYNINPFK